MEALKTVLQNYAEIIFQFADSMQLLFYFVVKL